MRYGCADSRISANPIGLPRPRKWRRRGRRFALRQARGPRPHPSWSEPEFGCGTAAPIHVSARIRSDFHDLANGEGADDGLHCGKREALVLIPAGVSLNLDAVRLRRFTYQRESDRTSTTSQMAKARTTVCIAASARPSSSSQLE